MEMLKERNIGVLLVSKRDKLAGIVTDRDTKRASASASDAATLAVHELLYLISKIRVQDIMTKAPITVPFDHTVEETAAVLQEE